MIKKFFLLPVVLLSLIFTMYLLGFVAFTLYSLYPPQIDTSNNTTDTAIILTGGENRITEGVALLKNKHVKHIFISGVGQDVKLDDIFPDTYQSLLCCVTLGYKAKDTIGNAKESYDWLQKNADTDSFYLVTSSYHMPRAHHLFKHKFSSAKYVINTYPTKMLKLSPNTEEFWHLIFKEYNKLLYTYTDLWITHAR